jgi:CRISPR-associated protein Cmr3
MAESIVPVVLEPRDGVFLKDGRGWCTSESNRAGSLSWPFGTTVRGALRAGLGYAVESDRGQPLGRREWLPLNEDVEVSAVLPLAREPGSMWTEASRHWPAPLDALLLDDQQHAIPLAPAAQAATILPLDDDPEAIATASLAHPAHAAGAGKPLAMPRFWPDEPFLHWLCGRPVDRRTLQAAAQPVSRLQTHVSIDATTGTAAEGKLFSGSVVEPHARVGDAGIVEWSFAAVSRTLGEARGNTLADRNVKLGGDGRTARCAPLPESLFAMPDTLAKAFDAGSIGIRLVLVGPAAFDAGWRPATLEPVENHFVGSFAGLDDVVLHAACVGRPVHVSGWNVAEGVPKATRRLAPAGSVYFLTRRSGQPFTAADARAVWLASVGEPADRPDRLGAVVPGIWNPAPEILATLGRTAS